MGSNPFTRRRPGTVAVLVAAALVVAGCSSSDGSAGSTETGGSGADGAEPAEVVDLWASDVPARPSPGCDASSTPEPGLTEETFDHDSGEREYTLLVPETDGEPAPLVVDMHGLGSNREQERNVSGYQALAERDGVAMVWPQGLGERPGWSTATGDANRDVDFVVGLVAATGEELCIDEARVYAAGISNGGLMSSALACGHGDVFAAVAPVAGFQTVPDCADPSSLILFYGTADAVLPWAGGVGEALGSVGSGEVPEIPEPAEPDLSADPGPFAPVPVNIAEWARVAGCDTERTEESVSDEVDRWVYEGCDGTAVEVYVVDDGGHSWPGNEGMATIDDPVIAAVIGKVTLDISATDLAWEFFAAHPQTA